MQGERNWDRVQQAFEVQEIDDIQKNFKELDSLKFELWDAFSDGGELQWIQDLELLNAMTFAYYSLKSNPIAGEEKLVFDAINSALEIIDEELMKV